MPDYRHYRQFPAGTARTAACLCRNTVAAFYRPCAILCPSACLVAYTCRIDAVGRLFAAHFRRQKMERQQLGQLRLRCRDNHRDFYLSALGHSCRAVSRSYSRRTYFCRQKVFRSPESRLRSVYGFYARFGFQACSLRLVRFLFRQSACYLAKYRINCALSYIEGLAALEKLSLPRKSATVRNFLSSIHLLSPSRIFVTSPMPFLYRTLQS